MLTLIISQLEKFLAQFSFKINIMAYLHEFLSFFNYRKYINETLLPWMAPILESDICSALDLQIMARIDKGTLKGKRLHGGP